MTGFDIHIDAVELNQEAERFLIRDLGFSRSDFCGHPEGEDGYEPPHHLTLKPTTSVEYKDAFDRVQKYFRSNPGSIHGYIEGEFFAFDVDLDSISFNVEILPPFTVTKKFLPPNTFRESEIHVTMSRDRSDPRLRRILREMGFFAAYLAKSHGVAEVFTVQGTKAQIEYILTPLFEFLKSVGGSVGCSVKEERVVGWWLSQPNLQLPPVIDQIHWC